LPEKAGIIGFEKKSLEQQPNRGLLYFDPPSTSMSRQLMIWKARPWLLPPPLHSKKSLKSSTGNKDSAKDVGKDLAEKLKKISVETVYFDRGGNLYHGRVQALAEGAREAGLNF